MKKSTYLIAVSVFISLLLSACNNDKEEPNPTIPSPTVTGFSPSSGSAETTVIIEGTNFSTNAASNVVKFNGTIAIVSTATATSLTVAVPASATSGKITVDVNSQTAVSNKDFTIVQGTAITDFSPHTGTHGTTVTITGINFSASIVNNLVKFNGSLALVTAATTTSLTVIVPEDAISGKITVQVGSQSATSSDDFILETTVSLDVSTFAGNGAFGFINDIGTAARFFGPEGIAIDALGNLYVADLGNHVIRKITPDGSVSTLAGSGVAGFADGTGTAAQFSGPTGITLDGDGNIYVADTFTQRIRKITPAGIVTTLAGSGTYVFGGAPGGYADGTGAAAKFHLPKDLAVDASGNIFVADDVNHRIRKVTPDGVVTTVAGSTLGSADGTGTNAQFNRPSGITIDASGNLYVADEFNSRIRKITPTGVVSTFAGSSSGFADGVGTAARFRRPRGIAIDNAGNIFVADAVDNRIRKITATGTVTTVAGDKNGLSGYKDGPARDALFRSPSGIVIDKSNKIYVSDAANHCIRKIQ